jgi:hypothetical protein
MCGVTILVVCSRGSAELFNVNNEYTECAVVTVQEMDFCTYALHTVNCAVYVA